MNQHSAPVIEALSSVERRPPAGFGAPGHSGALGVSADVRKAVGRRVFEADVLTPKGLDDRLETGQVLQRSHALAAAAWGADVARFSTGGSTQSIQTALAAVARPGETVLVARNAHKAEVSAAIYAGVDVRFVPAAIDPEWDLEHGVAPEALELALAEHPHAKAVVVVSPTYFGVTSDIAALAEVAHRRGAPLIVDAAWGAAYGFCDLLPANPMTAGADVMVASLHKTMACLAQGSVMLQKGDRVDPQRFALAYELFQTTSPSVPILAAMDGARREHALHGQALWAKVVRRARRARRRLAEVSGVKLLGRERLDGRGAFDLDETKITLDVSGLGVTGYEADDWMMRRYNVSVGLSDARRLLAIFSPGVSEVHARRLVEAVEAMAQHFGGGDTTAKARAAARAPGLTELSLRLDMAPCDAFAARTELIPYEDSAGRIAAEVIAPAPPGVPRLIPGQRIETAHRDWMLRQVEAGVFVLDPADPRQGRVRVVAA